MSRILLVDDSPHAQRMGERILSEEGYEVVTVSKITSIVRALRDRDVDRARACLASPDRNRTSP